MKFSKFSKLLPKVKGPGLDPLSSVRTYQTSVVPALTFDLWPLSALVFEVIRIQYTVFSLEILLTRGTVRIQAFPACPKSALYTFPSLRVIGDARVRIGFLGYGLKCLRMLCFHNLPALEPALEMIVEPCKFLLDSIDDRLLTQYLNHVLYCTLVPIAGHIDCPCPFISNAVWSI